MTQRELKALYNYMLKVKAATDGTRQALSRQLSRQSCASLPPCAGTSGLPLRRLIVGRST